MPSFVAVAQLLLSQPMNFSAHPRMSEKDSLSSEKYLFILEVHVMHAKF